jgi:N-acetylglucosamine-6-phosphate deacetylase
MVGMGGAAVTVLTGASVVTPDGIVGNGWVQLDGSTISGYGSGQAPDGVEERLDGGWLVPGYLDIHCHGGNAADFGSADPDQLTQAATFHLAYGSTGVLASLVTAPVSALCHQLAVAADVVESGGTNVVGIHLEGPFLSQHRCGAQNPEHLILPNLEDFTKMVDASRGRLTMMTIAPELPGAIELIEACAVAGVVAAIGHTDATYEQAAAAFRAGATVATHLFNGMRPIHHREPGPVLAALDAGAGCEVINDGVHVHPAVLRLVAERDPAQLVLITDAISATGIGDGTYELGGQQVSVSEGQARLATNGSLAGSTVTMDEAVRRAVTEADLPIEVAVAAASTNPARLMGMAGVRGSIAAGLVADLIHLDVDLRPLRIMRNGGWLQ